EAHWPRFWSDGGTLDLSASADPRSKELERRIVLSEYLTAVNSAGTIPPQETGETFNSWFGKAHLEMHWWHAAHFALWDRAALLERSLPWYTRVLPSARDNVQPDVRARVLGVRAGDGAAVARATGARARAGVGPRAARPVGAPDARRTVRQRRVGPDDVHRCGSAARSPDAPRRVRVRRLATCRSRSDASHAAARAGELAVGGYVGMGLPAGR